MSTEDKPVKGNILRSKTASGTTAKQIIGPTSSNIINDPKGHSIKVNKLNGTVDSIEVNCSCGERIIVKCDYE
ncbi:MAG: hypothetical protein GY880_25710 [Planctomycetaceae bacterium]|nr:hypothetical protein [Planctomycetaceae bacterium]MCP4479854.1 hypothetical protein [Planctomycetaceae bacterium]MCP4777631.1 hypothetical protein [Planctomycetaceae bacterium]